MKKEFIWWIGLATDFSGHFLLTGILAGLLGMQIIVEIKMIRKLQGFVRRK